MNDTANRIATLIGKHLKQDLSEIERQELNAWMDESGDHREIFDQLTNADYLEQTIREKYKTNPVESTREKLNRLIEQGEEPIEKKGTVRRIWPRLSVAAAILVLLAGTAIYVIIKNHNSDTRVAKTINEKPDISPGTNKATLKLADGRLIAIDSFLSDKIVQQGSITVYNKGGQLVYSPSDGSQNEVLWNTLSTAKGQTYPLLLSDGSKVTLNSESSISFPVAFTGNLREVKVTGEVFFQVAHDASKPFRVHARDMDLQVLGTSFNVNAYPDEDAVKATLVEGSVQINKGIQKRIIKPGQQAQVLANEIKVTEVDVDKITAWKQGFFRFKEDKLSEAMKNIARWYNVDVVFEGEAANIEVSGNLPRAANISELIRLLAAIDVQARIEGRKLILKGQQ